MTGRRPRSRTLDDSSADLPAPSIELRHARQVAAVADHGSMTRAAVDLGLSVSALSRSLKGIEQAAGGPLFVHQPGGSVVTDLGRLFLSHGRDMLKAAAGLGRHIESNPTLQTGRVAIGVGAKAAELSAGDVALQFIEQFPQVSLELRCGLVEDLAPALRSHELDFVVGHPAVLRERIDVALDITLLEPSPLVLAARAGHPLLARPAFTLLDAFDFLAVAAGHLNPRMLAVALELQSHCLTPLARERAWPGVLTPAWSVIEPLVLEADAMTLLPPTELAEAVQAGRLVPLASNGWNTTDLALMSLKSRSLSPAAGLFHERLQAAYARGVAEDHRLIAEWFPDGTATVRPAG